MTDFRILSIADNHVVEGARFDECVRVHENFVDTVRRDRPHAVGFGGDLFDRGSTPKDRLFAAEIIQQCAEHAPVYVVRGNHDRHLETDILAKLASRHPIRVCTTVGVERLRWDGHEAMIAMMAWPTRASHLDENGSREALRGVLGGLGQQMAGHKGPKILIGHYDITGAKMGAGQPPIGGALAVATSDLGLVGADLTIAGHIHQPQAFSFNGKPILYTGSPYATDWGETEQKSFLSASITPDGRVTWSRIPSGARPMIHVEADWLGAERLGFEWNGPVPILDGAEVRFRFRVDHEHQDEAMRAALSLGETWRSQGACTVKLDPQINTITRARVPEIATAVTLDAKLEHVWTSQDRMPTQDVKARLLGKLARLRKEGGREWQTCAIRYDRISGHGLGPLQDFDVDLSSMPGPIVAVTGDNGSGKSAFLEILSGVLDRTLPTRGSLVELAALSETRDAFVEAKVLNGQAWTIRHSMDGVSGKSEATMLDAHGVHALSDRKVTTFDDVASKTFPPPEVRFASTVRSQKSPGFLDLSPNERRGIVLRAIGVEWVESLAKQAREYEREAITKIDTIQARLEDEAKRLGVEPASLIFGGSEGARSFVDDHERALHEATSELRSAANAVLQHEEILTGLREETERAREANLARDRRLVDFELADRAVVEASDDRNASQEKLNASLREREGLADARAAASERDGLQAFVTARDAEFKAIPIDAMRVTVTAASQSLASVRRQILTFGNAIGAARSHVAEIAKLSEEAAKLGDADAKYDEAHRQVTQHRDDLATLTKAHVGSMGDRIAGLRGGLTELAGYRDDGLHTVAAECLQRDDVAILAQKKRPEEIERIDRDLKKVLATVDGIQRDRDRLVSIRARLKAIENQPEKLTELERDLAVTQDALSLHEQTEREANAQLAEAEARRGAIAGEVAKAAHTMALLSAKAKLAEGAQALDTRIAIEESNVARAESDILIARERLSSKQAEGPIPAPISIPAMHATEMALEHDRNRLTEAKVKVSQHERDVASVKEAVGRIESLQIEQSAWSIDGCDWARLAMDLGRDGLQNLEVDAAGPQLAALANDLLHTCHGPRWTVSIETQRGASDGKRMIEGFEVRVFDAQEGRSVIGKRLSGGQAAIVDEALSLALAMRSCPPTSEAGATLIRDESGAALDPENGRAYVRMLRKAVTHMGASKCLFVSHNEGMVEMADARIELSEGHVTISS